MDIKLHSHNLMKFTEYLRGFFGYITNQNNAAIIVRDKPVHGRSYRYYLQYKANLLGSVKDVQRVLRGEIQGQSKEFSDMMNHSREYIELLKQTIALLDSPQADRGRLMTNIRNLNRIHDSLHHESGRFIHELTRGKAY